MKQKKIFLFRHPRDDTNVLSEAAIHALTEMNPDELVEMKNRNRKAIVQMMMENEVIDELVPADADDDGGHHLEPEVQQYREDLHR